MVRFGLLLDRMIRSALRLVPFGCVGAALLTIFWTLPDPSICPQYDHGNVRFWEYERTDNLAQTVVTIYLNEAQQLDLPDPAVGRVLAWNWPRAAGATGQNLIPECQPTPVSTSDGSWEWM